MAKAMDRHNPKPGRQVKNRKEAAPRTLDVFGPRHTTKEALEIGEKRLLLQSREPREIILHPPCHLRRPRLGVGEAKNACGIDAIQKKA